MADSIRDLCSKGWVVIECPGIINGQLFINLWICRGQIVKYGRRTKCHENVRNER